MQRSSIIANKYYGSFTICISNDKCCYSFGNSSFYGHGHEVKQIHIPTKIKNLNNIKMISCGVGHTICLNFDGICFSIGDNYYGQLGIGIDREIVKSSYKPHQINLPLIQYISCGDYFTICLTEDNILYAFGDNEDGELGINNNEKSLSPILIPHLSNINLIECGGGHTICKTFDNIFYSWGNNDDGQLGQGHTESSNSPIQCNNWPDNIINIKCDDNASFLLTQLGEVYSFGFNGGGQLGLNDETILRITQPTLIKDIPEIQRIECGYSHTICIDVNKNFWVFGDNSLGQLGLGDKENRYKPILHPILSNIIDISSGGFHTFVKTIENKIYAFGWNNYSQLGRETLQPELQLTPIQVFQDNEDIWCSFIGKSKAKSARK